MGGEGLGSTCECSASATRSPPPSLSRYQDCEVNTQNGVISGNLKCKNCLETGEMKVLTGCFPSQIRNAASPTSKSRSLLFDIHFGSYSEIILFARDILDFK